MEQLNRAHRPAPAGGQQVPNQQPVQPGVKAPKNKKGGNSILKIVSVVAISVLVVALLVSVLAFVYNSTKGIGSEIKTDKYQAVFLNSADGQVYFGKLENLNKEYYKLSDIYYVRVEQVQPNPNEEPQQNISLAKLGNEIHGPEDEMFISKKDVMFWENLKDDGQVVTAITQYKETGSTTPNNQQPATQQPATNETGNANN